MNSKIIISKNIEELSDQFGQLLLKELNLCNKDFTLALSGGNTPKIIFQFLSEHYSTKIDWVKIKFFWGDERCVPPEDDESNFKSAKEYLFDQIEIVQNNIFRIYGENNPEEETHRYSKIIFDNVEEINSMPCFDMIMLGLGEDGHTASIFPGRLDLFSTNKICVVTEHPSSKQKRITLTGNVINNSRRIVFLVTGKRKGEIVDKIFNKKDGYEELPISHVIPVKGEIIWLLDKNAATSIKNM